LLTGITQTLQAYGPAGFFALGIVDSIGVPLPAAVDALLVTYAAKMPQFAYLASAATTAGSIIGNLLLYQGARFGTERLTGGETPAEERSKVRRWFDRLGLKNLAGDVTPDATGKGQRFRQWFERYGLLTVFIPAVTPFIPLPLKVFVVSAGVLRTPLSRFLAVVVSARILRYFGEAYLGIRLGEDARGYLTHNAWNIGGFAIGMTLLVIAAVRWYDRRRAEA
jgi:membrane protein DedA with SNARE-associated domain